MHKAFVLLCLCVLAGCATPAPSQLEPPAKALMVPPKPMPTLKAGDDLVHKHAELRRQYSTEAGKLTRLQRYVRTIVQK